MLIKYDKYGVPCSDFDVKTVVKLNIDNKRNIHTSCLVVIMWVRAYLHEMKKEDRPNIRWIFNDKEVYFDDDLRSFDAWKEIEDVGMDAAMILL